MMPKPIRLADSTITAEELDALCVWIKETDRLTKGPQCVAFEEAFAHWQGSGCAIFVNSGSSANLLMYQALLEADCLQNNVAVAPAVSWVTTVTPLMQLGFDVHLCDCNLNDLGLDLEHFETLCRDHRPALAVLVHVLGHANQLAEIKAICDRYDVKLVEDACEALGSCYQGRKLGSHGLAGSFSFYYGHHISTIEGGMVVTDDEHLQHVMLSIRSHGWGRDIPDEVHQAWKQDYDIDEIRDLYTFYYSGFNLRSTDLNAYLGLSQLERINDIVGVRQRNHQAYAAGLEAFWQQRSNTAPLSSFAYATFVANRLEVYHHLRASAIETRPLVCGNIGQQPFWIKRYGACSLPNADLVHANGLYLPNHANINLNDVDRVCSVFNEVAKPFSG